MNPRELLILLLGLAIVAVVLRGLYVALQARRGQIRLAIDKNIPRDVDLDALEMAELPSGGARVKPRNGLHSEANAEVQRATARANAMDLGDQADDGIPVLMDAVQVRRPEAQKKTREQTWSEARTGARDQRLAEAFSVDSDDFVEPGFAEADYADQRPAADDDMESAVAEDDADSRVQSGTDDWEDDWEDDFADEVLGPVRTSTRGSTKPETATLPEQDDEDPDAVLLDYEADGLSALAPDYADEDGEPGHDEPVDEESDFDDTEDGFADWEDEQVAESQTDDDPLADAGQRREPRMGSFEDELDEFSMSAGERIGYEGKPRSKPARQASLFDSDEEVDAVPDRHTARETRASKKPASKRKSLFAAFGRKKAAVDSDPVVETKRPSEPQPATTSARAKPQPPAPSASAQVMALDTTPANLDSEWGSELEPEFESQYVEDSQSLPSEPSEVLVINVMARHGREFAGDDLMRVLITSGLKFGDMNIFHQRLGNQPKGPVVFSVANMLNPGTFDLNKMDSFRTVGVSLFLALPTAINNLDAFEKMLAVARQLCEALDGELKDDNRNGMTAQTIEHYRQRVRDFELRQLKAAGSRG